ncbi:MAG: hypothetical protein U0V74_16325 [Chitinophagales bacterium]
MKQLCFFALLLLALSSCKIGAPTFQRMENLKFERVDGNGIKLGVDAVFHNPNFIKVKVSDIAVDVVLDKKLIGTLGEKDDIIVKRKSDFTIPLGIKVQPGGTLFEDLQTIFGALLSSKESEISIVGDIKMRTLCFLKYHVPIRWQQKIKLSQFKL